MSARTLAEKIAAQRAAQQAKRDAIARREARIAAFLAVPCCRCGHVECCCPTTCTGEHEAHQ